MNKFMYTGIDGWLTTLRTSEYKLLLKLKKKPCNLYERTLYVNRITRIVCCLQGMGAATKDQVSQIEYNRFARPSFM